MEFINLTVLTAPGPVNRVFGRAGHGSSVRADEFASLQNPHGTLDGTLGKAGGFRHLLMAEGRAIQPLAQRLEPDVNVNQECGRGLIVTNQVTHQSVDNVAVNRDICH